MAFIKKNRNVIIGVSFALLLLSVFTNFYRAEYRYGFGWDQARDAQIVFFKIIKDLDFALIGPRVVGIDGFFLGPLHYYLLVPFYILFKGDPIAGVYLAGIVGVLTTIAGYLISLQIFKNKLTSLVFGFILALNPVTISWNVMYMPLFSLVFYYFLIQIVKKRYKFIPYSLVLLAMMLQFHFSTIFLVVPFALTIFYSFKNDSGFNIPKKQFLTAFGLFLLSFAPLIVFDVKNDFLNTKLFFNFFFGNKSYLGFNFSVPLHIFSKAISSVYLPFNGTFIVTCIYLYESIKTKDKGFFLLNLVWLLVPITILLFYTGQISEYYFTTVLIVIMMYLANFISRLLSTKVIRVPVSIVVTVLFASYFTGFVRNISDYNNPESIFNKKQIVKFLVKQKKDKVFNVSYSTYTGGNVGFDYLFKWYGKEPQNVPEGHLYTIVIPAYSEDVDPIIVYGDIGLIRR
jgi:hypothetical protein